MNLASILNFFSPKQKGKAINNNKARYKSCIWLNQGINFDIDSYKICCLYSGTGGGDTIIKSNYKGEPVNWNEFFKKKREIRELHKKGKVYPKCEGCVFLQEGEWDDKEDFINFINLDYWTKCNCNCSYCHTAKDKEGYNSKETYNFLPILKDMIKRNILRPGGHVSFGGGEVTLLEEFEESLTILLNFGISNIRIHSACMDYSPAVEAGLKKGALDLVVSVDSGSKEMHRRIKQVDTYDTVWENLRNYASHQARPDLVKTKYIVVPGLNDQEREIELWLEKCKSVGINSVIQEIEAKWFYGSRENVPRYIYKLFDFTKAKAIEMGLEYGLYERAEHLMNERKAKETTNIT